MYNYVGFIFCLNFAATSFTGVFYLLSAIYLKYSSRGHRRTKCKISKPKSGFPLNNSPCLPFGLLMQHNFTIYPNANWGEIRQGSSSIIK